MDGTNPKSLEELKANQECIRTIDSMLKPYADRVKELSMSADREGLIRYFGLDSEDPEVLEDALKKMWSRVGLLQNAAVAAQAKGDDKELVELEAEINEIRELRVETQRRINELKG